MADKDHDKDKDKAPKPFDNPNQDPNHPANITQPRDMRPGAERDRIDGPVYARENTMTEQEKAAAGNPSDSAKTPYPVGDPPPPSEVVTRGQGIKGVTDQPVVKPDEVKGPGAIDKNKKETHR